MDAKCEIYIYYNSKGITDNFKKISEVIKNNYPNVHEIQTDANEDIILISNGLAEAFNGKSFDPSLIEGWLYCSKFLGNSDYTYIDKIYTYYKTYKINITVDSNNLNYYFPQNCLIKNLKIKTINDTECDFILDFGKSNYVNLSFWDIPKFINLKNIDNIYVSLTTKIPTNTEISISYEYEHLQSSVADKKYYGYGIIYNHYGTNIPFLKKINSEELQKCIDGNENIMYDKNINYWDEETDMLSYFSNKNMKLVASKFMVKLIPLYKINDTVIYEMKGIADLFKFPFDTYLCQNHKLTPVKKNTWFHPKILSNTNIILGIKLDSMNEKIVESIFCFVQIKEKINIDNPVNKIDLIHNYNDFLSICPEISHDEYLKLEKMNYC
jgi:hypothetical protein